MIRSLAEYYISFFYWLAKRSRRFVALSCHSGSSRCANPTSASSKSKGSGDYTRVRETGNLLDGYILSHH